MTTDERLPYLPPALSKLRDLALNLRYTWDPDTIRLFQELGEGNWLESARNPIRTLEMTPLERLQDLAADPEFLERLDHRWRKLLEYIERPGWFAREFPEIQDRCIAYFSAEFGLDAGLPMYSGGLGVLAGDHLKSASDLDLPLVAVGLLFRFGYFHQSISVDGAQVEKYLPNEWRHMPVTLVRDESGAPVTFEMIIGEHHARLQIWQAQVGHVRLFLLDTDLPENDRSIREATAALYPGDKDLRLRQEITLGIGGARALRTLGLTPCVYHANEGHSIFLIFERLKHLMQEHHLNYNEALEFIRSTTVFTTHTPVPAGNELFSPEMLEPYLRSYADDIGISWRDFLGLGRSNPSDVNEWFSLTIAALKNSAFVNGVSALHGQVSRKMWKHVWPGYSAPETPIDSITNGAHPRTWVSDRMWRLYEKHLGEQINDCPENCVIWENAVNLPDAELWSAHEYRRSKLINLARARLVAQREARAESMTAINAALSALDPKALTIGFARRFTSYKRGALIFSDLERLISILANDERPVQLIFSGKAHPMDEPGKGLVNTVYQLSRDERMRGRLIYLEDYDMTVARYLVGGCDVWLNNPRRPEEASGTSGMKAALNGAVNLSALDGWWAEAYTPEAGWKIGDGDSHDGRLETDQRDAAEIYRLLEEEIVPTFYDRDPAGVPVAWVAKMKHSIRIAAGQFSSHRMVTQYVRDAYANILHDNLRLRENDFATLRAQAADTERFAARWRAASIAQCHRQDDGKLEAIAAIGELDPEELICEFVIGDADFAQTADDYRVIAPEGVDRLDGGRIRFHAYPPAGSSGAVTARLRPRTERLQRRLYAITFRLPQ